MYTHTTEYYSALRRKEIPTQMNLEDTVLNEICQSQKNKIICDFTYILLRVVKFIEAKSRIMVARARGEPRIERCCLMDTQCKLEKVKKFWW